ncbi:MAG: hypothetical protein K1060chlam1_00242 [Candidatus Anoxychlamydiales bacterium]|nr:hypothetical protein [Candidatus Anoxychlamydiales bacterium]
MNLKVLKSYIILIAITISSSIFADINVNFSNPISTPPDTTTPNLSDPNQTAILPQIATSYCGRNVYAIWQRQNDGIDFQVQTAISSDFGRTWNDPISTPPSTTTPNLSVGGDEAEEADITTNSSGKYVYAVWDKEASPNAVIQVAISHDYGQTWQNPTSTPLGTTTPNLSVGGDADVPHVVTDQSGKYVYAIWFLLDGDGNTIVQVAISHDYGVTWQNPTTSPPGTTSPNLSVGGANPEGTAFNQQIVTNSTGQYVYVLWQRSNGSDDIVQIVISSDFGVTWQDPTTTPPGTLTPNLSVIGKQADEPNLATDSTGKFVYAVWDRKNDSSNEIVQIAISSDFGVTWQNPTSTPPGTSTPNLSTPGGNGEEPFVVTDISGKFVYVTWFREGAFDIAQVAISHDFGKTFQNPTTTPLGTIPPNLSLTGGSAHHVRIGVDNSGRYIYIVWHRDDGTHLIIQEANSSDFGVTWQDPTTTPPGTLPPELSLDGGTADAPALVVDGLGNNIYVIWYRNDGIRNIVQVANGLKTLFPIRNLTIKSFGRGD